MNHITLFALNHQVAPNAGIDAGETATRNFGLKNGRSYEASCFASRPMTCWAAAWNHIPLLSISRQTYSAQHESFAGSL